MMKLENLYPERVFYYFEKLTEIPDQRLSGFFCKGT